MKKLIDIFVKMSKREKAILFFASAALALVFLDRVVIGPAFHKMAQIERKIADEEIAIKKSLHILLRKNQIAAEGKQFANFSVEGKTAEEEMTALLKDVEVLADKTSVSLLYVRPGQIKEEAGLKRYYASLECESSMENIASFFHAIENSTRLLQIDKYEIQPKAKESSASRCTVSISKTVLSR